MKKLFFIFLGILLFFFLSVMGCKQSVEPGTNNFPTIDKTIQQVQQNKYFKTFDNQDRQVILTIIRQEKKWIKYINRLYLKKPRLNAYTQLGDVIQTEKPEELKKLQKKYFPPASCLDTALWALAFYYESLQKNKATR